MHEKSLEIMSSLLDKAQLPFEHDRRLSVLDVGSYDVNGSLRPLILKRGMSYIGLDIRPGKGVDVVSADPYYWPYANNIFDVVVCANMLHNCEHPWRLLPEMARVLRTGGLLAVVTIWQHAINEHPKDYWRFTRDGLYVLFDSAGRMGDIICDMDAEGNAWGSAIKW
jgi:SAM-dependent methyltransferase